MIEVPCWVSPEDVPAPNHVDVLVRTGNCYCFAAFSVWSGQWVMLHNGKETKIDPPAQWQLTGPILLRMKIDELQMSIISSTNEGRKINTAPPATRRGQMLFDLSDSESLSRRVA